MLRVSSVSVAIRTGCALGGRAFGCGGRAPDERCGFARARAAHRAAQSTPVAGARARAPEAGRLRAGREHRGALQLLGGRRQPTASRELAPHRAGARCARRRGRCESGARSRRTAEVRRGPCQKPEKKAAGKTLPAAVVTRNSVRLTFAVRSPEHLSRCYFFAGAAARTFSHTVVVVAILPSIADLAGSFTILSLRDSS